MTKLKEKIAKVLEWNWTSLKCPYCGFKTGKPSQTMHHAISRHYDQYFSEYDLVSRLSVFIQSEITKALQSYSQEMNKINEVMWIEKEKDKTGHDVGWNSALAEHEARKLKVDKKWGIK